MSRSSLLPFDTLVEILEAYDKLRPQHRSIDAFNRLGAADDCYRQSLAHADAPRQFKDFMDSSLFAGPGYRSEMRQQADRRNFAGFIASYTDPQDWGQSLAPVSDVAFSVFCRSLNMLDAAELRVADAFIRTSGIEFSPRVLQETAGRVALLAAPDMPALAPDAPVIQRMRAPEIPCRVIAVALS